MHELIQLFALVVEYNSQNRVAKMLNISQPALSRKISKLEEELGVTLFDRIGKKLQLTDTGKIVYDYALQYRSLHNELLRELSQSSKNVSKQLTIGASLTTLQSTLPDLIHLLISEVPNADIKAITGKTHEIVQLVEDRKVDIGLVAQKVSHEFIRCIPLFEDHLCLVIPKQHPLSEQHNITLNDLEKLPMILFAKGTWYRILMDELFQHYRLRPEIKMEIDSFEAILRLVSTCKAATLLPKSYLRETQLNDNDLVYIQIDEWKKTTRTTSLIYTDLETLNPLARTLIEKAVTHYAKANG